MSALDLSWEVLGSTIVDPLTVADVDVIVTVTNLGATDLTGLGLYVVPSTVAGTVDLPASNPAETDYQDLLEWGSATDAAITLQGGLLVTCTQPGPSAFVGYVTRTQGATIANKILIEDLAAGASTTVTLQMQTPPGVTARRFYTNVVISD
jgi:hypothetical protein